MSCSRTPAPHVDRPIRLVLGMVLLLAFCCATCLAQQSGVLSAAALPQAPSATPGTISGTVKDVGGATVPQAHITLTQPGMTDHRETTADSAGDFTFTAVPPGPFTLSIVEEGLEPGTVTGTLHPGESLTVSSIALKIATARQDVSVSTNAYEIAEAEIHQEEHQRVLGVVPNFFVSYIPDPAPLKTKQKFELSGKVIFDPTTFLFAGIAAAIEQANDTYPGFGCCDTVSYFKRYGATLATSTTATLLRGAVFPSLFHQDPRYFYKGTGTVRARILYALSTAVICKGDNGRWQPNYSGIGGNLAAGALSNLYYARSDRKGVNLTFENALIGIGGTAAGHVVQEFVYKHFTPRVPKPVPTPTPPTSLAAQHS